MFTIYSQSVFLLAHFDFVLQSNSMNPNWAEENLQTIRTLMERSALYRRALAPIMLFAGMLGAVAAAAGLLFHLDSMRTFGALWLGTAAVAVAGAFLIARRQALKDKEIFWSPPTRRVGQALAPPLFAGMFLGIIFAFVVGLANTVVLTFIWLLFYGCALHSAGFFMSRGMRFFGWIFVGMACAVLCFTAFIPPDVEVSAHWLMGFFFGVLHLAYGAYLYLTEKKNSVA
jgi:hypothetical protein